MLSRSSSVKRKTYPFSGKADVMSVILGEIFDFLLAFLPSFLPSTSADFQTTPTRIALFSSNVCTVPHDKDSSLLFQRLYSTTQQSDLSKYHLPRYDLDGSSLSSLLVALGLPSSIIYCTCSHPYLCLAIIILV